MKRTFLIFLFAVIVSPVFGQKDFEGVMVFRDEITSKTDVINSRGWEKIMAIGDSTVCSIKNGKFRQSGERKDAYFIPEKQKLFFKFKGIDTLFYMDSNDTASVLSVTKTAALKKIAGYDCNEIVIQTPQLKNTYFYSPLIYLNPVYSQHDKIDRYDVFASQTSSLYLGLEQETKMFTLKTNCARIEARKVDDAVFTLPDLPQKEMDWKTVLRTPYFEGKETWNEYLQKNIDATIAAKYLKMTRKEQETSQVVYVNFAVSETGDLSDIKVLNKTEVHPKIAEEAIRVIAASNKWHPATAHGEPIWFRMTQPITFQVVKQ